MWWWGILGYAAVGLVTIRVTAEIFDDSGDDGFGSITCGVVWPVMLILGLCVAVYLCVLKPLATPRWIWRRRRQVRVAEIIKTQAIEAEKAARDYNLPYPALEAIIPVSTRLRCDRCGGTMVACSRRDSGRKEDRG